MVGNDAVYLFGHFTIVASQTRFYVCYGDVQFRRRQRTREDGVGVTLDDNEVGLLPQ